MLDRPKKVKGLCGAYFVQDEYMVKGDIHFTCERDSDYWLRTVRG